jgi:MOSC domain-containing protein YiiM
MGTVIAVNISQKRGTDKITVHEANVIADWGVEGDAHSGDWDRQVSIFPVEALENVPLHKKEEVMKGGYTENITIIGIPLSDMSINKILKVGEAKIKILHIGKEEPEEHGRPYIVSREGRFGRVIESGRIKTGDNVQLTGDTKRTSIRKKSVHYRRNNCS